MGVRHTGLGEIPTRRGTGQPVLTSGYNLATRNQSQKPGLQGSSIRRLTIAMPHPPDGSSCGYFRRERAAVGGRGIALR